MTAKPSRTARLAHLLLLSLFLWSCGDDCTTCPHDGGDWPTAAPGSQGMDSNRLAEMTGEIRAGNMGPISSLLVIRNGYLVYEEYFLGMTAEDLHHCYSVTKSFASTLVGIARDMGAVQDLDTPLLDFFPQYPAVENDGPWKRAITLEHALQMRTGFEWDELSVDYTDYGNPLLQLFQSSDWIKHTLDLPMAAEPGTEFAYNTGVSILLSGVLEHGTGQTAEAFAEEVLFEPMDIRRWEWSSGPTGTTDTGSGLLLRPRDMAKLGYLYLNGGLWEPSGERLVSSEWVDASTQPYTLSQNGTGYGFQWWSMPVEASGQVIRIPYAVGWGGQRIYVVPPLDMVVVMTAEGYAGELIRRGEILLDFLFPAADPGQVYASPGEENELRGHDDL